MAVDLAGAVVADARRDTVCNSASHLHHELSPWHGHGTHTPVVHNAVLQDLDADHRRIERTEVLDVFGALHYLREQDADRALAMHPPLVGCGEEGPRTSYRRIVDDVH